MPLIGVKSSKELKYTSQNYGIVINDVRNGRAKGQIAMMRTAGRNSQAVMMEVDVKYG